ncbi:MAG: hydrogenase maturation protease [Coriobacteriales bacterium]|jgi:hydrogenase maturation protease|nr:hydrogenase maturation protease [Coriobacteriales bacterium]
MTQEILILCIGNVLMLDEGVGPRIARELNENHELPAGVSVIDRGCMGMALLSDLKTASKVLVVDAVDKTGYAPGTVVTFKPADIAAYQAFHGAHDTRLVDVLQALELLGYTPEVDCLGVQVENMHPENYCIGLTPPVEAAVPIMVQSCRNYLAAKA